MFLIEANVRISRQTPMAGHSFFFASLERQTPKRYLLMICQREERSKDCLYVMQFPLNSEKNATNIVCKILDAIKRGSPAGEQKLINYSHSCASACYALQNDFQVMFLAAKKLF